MTAMFDGAGAIGWLATFAVHSTIVLGTALLVSTLLGRRAAAVQEALLRASLWIAVVSTTVQWSGLVGSMAEDLVLPQIAPPAGDAALAPSPAASPVFGFGASPTFAARWSWQAIVLATATGSALLGVGWLLLVRQRLARVLADRAPETDPRILAAAAAAAHALGARQSPHVSRSERIGTPIAIGWLTPEICLPRRAGELGDASLRAMLAHEIAHLRRRDPAWMWAAAWLHALFPWQLLFVAVRRRWARLVELRCDAIAAAHASPTAVAGCLLDVAEWVRPPRALAIAPSMAARPSALRERVEAVLRCGAAPRSSRSSRALCSAALAAVTFGAPGFVAKSESEAGDAAEMPLFALPAPFASTPAPASPAPAPLPQLRTLLRMLESEQEQLAADAARLRRELRTQRQSPELGQLEAELTRRLSDLERKRARLEALLARKSTDAVRRGKP